MRMQIEFFANFLLFVAATRPLFRERSSTRPVKSETINKYTHCRASVCACMTLADLVFFHHFQQIRIN